MAKTLDEELVLDVSTLIEEGIALANDTDLDQSTDDLSLLQIESEILLHKNQQLPRLRAEMRASEVVMAMVAACEIEEEFCIDLICQMALHKKADVPTMVGLLRHHLAKITKPEEQHLVSQCVADAIAHCVNADLVEWNPSERKLVVAIDVAEHIRKEMSLYQYPLPMVVEPRELKTNMDTGYLHFRKGSVILKNNHHDGDVCLDHLNRMNKIRLKLDHEVDQFVKNSWKNLDKKKWDETDQDFEKRKRAFKKYDSNAHDVFTRLGLLTGEEFYLTHKVDKRGRTYCQGYYVTYQGNPWNKASIQFAEEEVTEL